MLIICPELLQDVCVVFDHGFSLVHLKSSHVFIYLLLYAFVYWINVMPYVLALMVELWNSFRLYIIYRPDKSKYPILRCNGCNGCNYLLGFILNNY